MKAVIFVANQGHKRLGIQDEHRFYLDVSAAWPVTQLQPVSTRTFHGVVSPVTPRPPLEILTPAEPASGPAGSAPPAYGRPYLVR